MPEATDTALDTTNVEIKVNDTSMNTGTTTAIDANANTGQPNNNTPNQIPAMPEGGRDKYYNPQTGAYDMESHLKEDAYNAERRAKSAAPATTDTKADSNTPAQNKTGNGDILSNAGLDANIIVGEISQFGDISDASREALQAQGLPKEMIDGYVEGINAKSQLRNMELTQQLGGAEQVARVHEWVEANLDDAHKQRVYEGIASDSWQLELHTLLSMMGESAPRVQGNYNPRVATQGGGNGVAGVPQTMTQAEYAEAVRSPRFNSDPAYRDAVKQAFANGGLGVRTP